MKMKKLVIMLLMFVISIYAVNALELSDGIVSCLSFDNADTTSTIATDLAGNNDANGTDILTSQAGQIGEGIAFDGTPDRFISMDDSATLDIMFNNTFTFTLSVWIAPNKTHAPVVFEKGDCDTANPNPETFCGIQNVADFTWRLNGGTGNNDFATTVLPIDTYIMKTVVANATRLFFYDNGTSQGDSVISISPGVINDEAFRIGHFRDINGGAAYEGLMDNLILWNRALNSTEITSLFNSGTGTACSTLVADTTNPVVAFSEPSNLSTQGNAFNVDIVCTDDFISNLTTTITNSSGGIISTTINSTPTGNELKFLQLIDLTAEPDQDFTITTTCVDNSNNQASLFHTITKDGTLPVAVIVSPNPNNLTVSQATGQVDIRGFNINLNISNLTIFNSTNAVSFQNITTGLGVNSFNMTDSIATVLSGQPDGVYRFRGCFVDTVANEACQESLFTLDTTAPVLSALNINNNDTTEALPIQVNSTCTDLNDLSLIAVENNETGLFVNQSSFVAALSPTTLSFNDTAVEGFISYRFTCVDGAGNSGQSALISYEGAAAAILGAFGTTAIITTFLTFLLVAGITVGLLVESFKRPRRGGRK